MLTWCPTPLSHIGLGPRRSASKRLSLERIFSEFAPDTPFTYVQNVDGILRECAERCWDSVLIRTFHWEGRTAGYLASVLLEPGALALAKARAGDEFLIKSLESCFLSTERMAGLNNVGSGSEAHVASIFWDIKLPIEIQVEVLKGMTTSFRRFFSGNRVQSFFVQALPEYRRVLEDRGYSRESPIDPHSKLSIWVRRPSLSFGDAIEDSFASNEPPLVPSRPAKLSESHRVQLRYLYEFGWQKDRIAPLFSNSPDSAFKVLAREFQEYLLAIDFETQISKAALLPRAAWLEFCQDLWTINHLNSDLERRILPRILARHTAGKPRRHSFESIAARLD